MTRKSKNIKTGQSGFLRYMKGEMSGSERNAFERDLQKDSFAEEASEGFEQLSPDEMEKDLSLLAYGIQSRVKRKRNYVFYRIAASVAVLMIVSSIFIIVERNNTKSSSALTEQQQVPFTIARSEPIVPKPESSDQVQRSTESQRERKNPVVSSDEQLSEKKSDQAIENIQKEEAFEQAPEARMPEEPIRAERRAVAEAPAQMPAGAAAEKSLKKSEPAATEDSMPQSALNEVVVTGYGVSSKGDESSASYRPPQPVIGKTAYNRYIEANIHRPDSANAGQRAVVVARFPVLADGTIGSIDILRTPGEEFSREARRLISSGPAWNPALRNGVPVLDSVTLRIIFK